MSDEPNKDVIAEIEAGGVRVSLNGPEVTGIEAYTLWQKIYDTIHNGRNRIASGSGFQSQIAEAPERSDWIGAGGPKAVGPGFSPGANPHMIKPPIEFGEVPGFDSPEARRVECFHPWPGCHCEASGGGERSSG